MSEAKKDPPKSSSAPEKQRLEKALFVAARDGDIAKVTVLLQQGVSANAKGALCSAAQRGHKEIVALLLNRGADIDVQADSEEGAGATSLHLAAEAGYVGIVSMLLERGAQVNILDEFKRTALHQIAAVNHNSLDENEDGLPLKAAMIDRLCAAGVDINAQDSNGRTALHEVVEHREPSLIQYLLRQGADANLKNNKGETAASAADYPNYSEDPGDSAPPSKDKAQNSLGAAAEAKFSEPKPKRSLLHDSIEHNGDRVEKLLREEEVSVDLRDNESGMNALEVAMSTGASIAVTRMLLESKADVESRNHFGRTALHQATKQDKPQLIELLLSHKANIDAQDEDGYTPLHIAAQQNHLKSVQLLLDKGANSNLPDNHGKTAAAYPSASAEEKFMFKKEKKTAALIHSCIAAHQQKPSQPERDAQSAPAALPPASAADAPAPPPPSASDNLQAPTIGIFSSSNKGIAIADKGSEKPDAKDEEAVDKPSEKLASDLDSGVIADKGPSISLDVDNVRKDGP